MRFSPFHITAQATLEARQEHARFIYILMMDRRLHRRLRLSNISECSPVILEHQHNSQSQGGLTVLHESVVAGNIDLAELIIEEGLIEDINEADEYGNTPLHYAVLHDCSENGDMIRLIIRKGGNINSQNNLGDTPLHNSIYRGNITIIKILTGSHDINIDIENTHGVTPFFSAILLEKGREIINLLLQYKPALTNSSRQSILHILSQHELKNPNELFEILKNLHFDIDSSDSQGNTAMHLAILRGNLELIKFLAEKGASLDRLNQAGKNPRNIATESFNTYVKQLIQQIEQRQGVDEHAETNLATP